MKKTTYIMLGLMVAGVVCAMGVMAVFMHSYKVDVARYKMGGETVSIKFDNPVHKVVYVDNDTTDGGVVIRGIKGLKVRESDTATEVTVDVASDWTGFLDCRVDSGALSVSINYEAMHRYYDVDVTKRRVFLNSEDFVIACVNVPKGMLREVDARWGTVYVDSLKTDVLVTKVDDRLVLNHSHIARLESRSKTIRELKLEDSTVGKADIRSVAKKFTVVCKDDSSMIDSMYIDGAYRKPKKVNLNFRKANIGHFKYNPADKNTVANVYF